MFEFKLKNSTPEESQELERLLNELKEKGAKSDMIEDLRRSPENRTISFETFYAFSKWCNTGGSHKSGEPIAKQISKLLFDDEIPRLGDKRFSSIGLCMI